MKPPRWLRSRRARKADKATAGEASSEPGSWSGDVAAGPDRVQTHEEADRSVDHAVTLVVAVLRNDLERLEREWRYHADLLEVVTPLVMIVRVLGAGVDALVPDSTGERLLEELTQSTGPQYRNDPGLQEAMRDGAALTLAWYRDDRESFEALLAPYGAANGELLLGAIGNVVLQMVSSLDHRIDAQERIVRSAGEAVRRQLRDALDAEG